MGRGIGGSLGSSSGRGIGGATGSKSGHSSLFTRVLGGTAKLGEHFASDVSNAVTGLPTGLAMTVEHPVRSGKAIVRQTWHDWAPLAEGHPVKFLKQTYDHPLAPLLDVATVFSAGAGAAAKLGDASVALGSDSALAKAASELGKSRVRYVNDTKGAEAGAAGKPMIKTYSANAGANLRRFIANRAMLHLEPHLPAWFKQSAREGRLYARLTHVEDAHKLFAQHVQTTALLKAAKVMTDPSVQKIIHPALLQHAFTALHRFATPKDAAAGLTKDEVYVLRGDYASKLFKYKPRSSIEQRFNRFGRDFTTTDPAKAEFDLHSGKLLVVRKDMAKRYGAEGANSATFLKRLPGKATTWWKRINVGYAPRTVANNAVGNWFMYAMRTAGHGGARGLIDAIRHTHGVRAANAAFKDMHAHILETQGADQAARFLAAAHPALHDAPNVDAIRNVFGERAANAVARHPNWVDKHFKNEIGNTFGHALEMTSAGEKGIRGHLAGAAKSGFYPLVHQVADQPVRVASLYHFMRRAPEVKQFLRAHPGETIDSAISKVLERNPNALRERAVAHVRSVAGDYVTRGPIEKLVSNIVPFYLWDKHILQHMGAMASEQPGRLALTQNVSRMGNDEIKKLLGELPSYLGNVLPLEALGLHTHGDRTPILSTQGLNPYATVGDLAKTAAAFTTGGGARQGADAASNLSPLLTGLIEQISGHRIGSNAPVPQHGGVLPGMLVNTAENLGYGKLIESLLGHGQGSTTSKGNPTLYSHSRDELISSLLGIPIKKLSEAAAAAAAAKENPKKRGHRGIGGV